MGALDASKRRRCTLCSLCPALRLLNGDVPTKSGADALKLIAVLKSQDGRAGLAVDRYPRPLVRAVVHNYNATHCDDPPILMGF